MNTSVQEKVHPIGVGIKVRKDVIALVCCYLCDVL